MRDEKVLETRSAIRNDTAVNLKIREEGRVYVMHNFLNFTTIFFKKRAQVKNSYYSISLFPSE